MLKRFQVPSKQTNRQHIYARIRAQAHNIQITSLELPYVPLFWLCQSQIKSNSSIFLENSNNISLTLRLAQVLLFEEVLTDGCLIQNCLKALGGMDTAQQLPLAIIHPTGRRHRTTSVTSQSKSLRYRTQGLETKLTRDCDFHNMW